MYGLYSCRVLLQAAGDPEAICSTATGRRQEVPQRLELEPFADVVLQMLDFRLNKGKRSFESMHQGTVST
jgi:hypothetical protein